MIWIFICVAFLLFEGLILSDAVRHDRREQAKADHEADQASSGYSEPSCAAAGQAIVETPSGSKLKKSYFSKAKNWISLGTLIFVGAYTIVTFWSFFVGFRALIYFDKAIIEISDKPVPNGGAIFNGPWVTYKAASFNIALTNAGSTSTRNMQVQIVCLPIFFAELDKVDPFTRFKWDKNSARSKIAGPHQTIQVGPCDVDTASETFLNAQMGIVPIVLMGEVR